MKRLNILSAMLFFGFVCGVVAWGDIINLKSGGRFEGIIQKETDDAITLLLPEGGIAIIRRDMVKSVEKTSPKEQIEKSYKPKKKKEKSEYRRIEQESKTQKYKKELQEQDKKPEIQKPEKLIPEPTVFPDGLVGRRYSFVLTPEDATPPYKLTLLSGTLPPGLITNERIGGIEGEPNQPGEWELELSLVDSKGKKETIKDTIHIWKRLLTVGKDGTFKGFDGIQMALNMAQDFDEIRIQSGVYRGVGLVIPENKKWDHGIKFSGGWDEEFLNTKGKTILDGGKRENSILTISNEKGELFFENLIVRNSGKFAIYSDNENDPVSFTNCIFNQNSTKVWGGGAIYVNANGPEAVFTNCIFSNNIGGDGGAVEVRNEKSTFINCVFKNNRAWRGGAVTIEYGKASFTNCTFNNNVAEEYGGAVFSFFNGRGIFSDCNFIDNVSKGEGGGALHGVGTFVNCTFYNNKATEIHELEDAHGGAIYLTDDSTFINCVFFNNLSKTCGGSFYIYGRDNLTLINCLFFKNSASYGGAIYSSTYFREGAHIRAINCTFSYNRAEKGGGAILCEEGGDVKIINSIFCKNMTKENNDIESKEANISIDYCLINHLKGVANYGAHNITGAPKFVAPGNSNFSLRADSPCIDKGTTLEEIKKEVEEIIKEIEDEKIRKMAEKSLSSDLAGNPRIAGGKADLGAYEWQGSKTIRVGSVKAKREKGEVEEKERILGKWKGKVLTSEFGTYPVEVTINRISKNLKAGTTKYPLLNCGETLWYLGFKDNTFTFRQQLNYNYGFSLHGKYGRCVGGGTIELKILSNNSLHWQSYHPSGRKGSSGTLRKEQE